MRFIKLVYPTLLIGLITGCAHQPLVNCTTPKDIKRRGPALVGLEYGMQMTPIPLDAVQMTDAIVANSLAVQSVRAVRTETDTVQVVARLVNCTDNAFAVRARTSFMDKSQLPAEPISAWRTVYLPARSTAIYQEYSTSQDVGHYLIELAKD